MKSRLRSFAKFVGWCALVCVALAIGAAVAAAVVHSRYEARAAEFDLKELDEVPERSIVYDGNGELYSYLGGENRLVVPLGSVSKHFIEALLAREDSRFWEHRGVDWRGVVRAAVTNFRAGETQQGASTITQQLARNSFDLRARTLDRKALEAALAMRIEKAYKKPQILEYYVNRIYFGSGYYGIETAARGYFGKPAAELTLDESAMLAGLIRSPNRLAPSKDLDVARRERDVVLTRMEELGYISAADATAARAVLTNLAPRSTMRFANDYVMDGVIRELEARLAPEVIDYGGLRIFMTVDPQLQRLAMSAADRRLSEVEEQKNYPHPKKRDFNPQDSADESAAEQPTDYLQAAVVVIDNRTGAIRAIVGGRDYQQSKYSRALLAKRQIGSTFKPFVYAAAFQRGLLPGTLVDDSKLRPGEFRDINPKWSPENSDGQYSGLQPAAVGLLKSRNTMSVRVGEYAGVRTVRDLARSLGIGEAMPELAVSFLGAFETTLKDLTAAYSIFPNGGLLKTPHLIARIEDREGEVLWQAPQMEKRVLDPDKAWMVSQTLQQVMKTGTAAKASSMGFKKSGAGKTGTTNDYFDAWFVGYTSTLTCGVWVGMDKPQTILDKGYGGTLALPIWADIMQQAPEKMYPAAAFEPPTVLAKVQLCSVSGNRATGGCSAGGHAYETSLPAPSVPVSSCQTHPDPTSFASVPAVVPEPPTPAPAPTYSAQLSSQPPAAGAVVREGYAYAYPNSAPAPREPSPQPQPQQRSAVTNLEPTVPDDLPAGAMVIERTEGGVRFIHTPTPDATPMPVRRAIPVRQSDGRRNGRSAEEAEELRERRIDQIEAADRERRIQVQRRRLGMRER